MALTIGDNFSYQGAKPLDGRIKYDTLAAMKAMADSTLYDGCLAYCVATDKTYQWKSTNTVDPDTGKWREFMSGGGTGGGHTIEDPEGTALTQRDTLQFGGDLEVSDDGENEKTVVTPHELTTAELTEIMSTLPGGHGNDGNPVGTIISFMGVTAPYGYLICDGSLKNIADYSRLADLFESQFGTKNFFGGNGTTTFAVPDLRGEFLRGTGTNSHANQGSGANVGVHQDGTQHLGLWAAVQNSSIAVNLKSGEGSFPIGENFDSYIGRSSYLATGTLSKYNEPSDFASRYMSRPTNTSVLYCIRY